MVLNRNWKDDWRGGDARPLVAYDDDYEYRLKRSFGNGTYAVKMIRVESTSGEEVPLSDGIVEYASAEGAGEVIVFWGEKLARDWLSANAA